MDFRSSSSVASLALLIAGVGFALLAPAAQGGDRLEFSAPAFPLAVPHPVVETKESKSTANSSDSPTIIDGPDLAPQEQFIVTRSKHKDQDDWDAIPILGEDKDKREFDDWLMARPEPNLSTNTSNLNMPHGWDGKNSDDLLHTRGDSKIQRRTESGFEAGRDASKFGTPLGFDADNTKDGDRNSRDGNQSAREADRFGQDSSNDKESSSWFKTLAWDSLDKDRKDRFSAEQTSFKDEFRSFEGNAHDFGMSEPKGPADPAHDPSSPSAFDTYKPFDNSPSSFPGEQTGEQFGADQSLRAWEQPSFGNQLPSRSSSFIQSQIQSRSVAPNRPINLPFPKRPGDF
jgi:hypothetical protein